jgi:hypothetical protein
MLNDQFRQALEEGDVKLVRRLAAYVMPHLPQPASDAEAEATMHLCRTGRGNITLKARAYSHKWLLERGLPSHLPDHLKPSAERLYPRVVEAVGISVKSRNPLLKDAMASVQRSMELVVEDMYANGDKDPARVKTRMMEAHDDEMRRLFGNLPVKR